MADLPQGIHVISSAQRGPNAGYFNLPPSFDQKKYVAHWERKGAAVDQRKQVQPILGTNYGSDGWEVWKYPAGHELAGRPAEVALKSGAYILMFRPRSVQESVNAICGNVSKRHLMREARGETIAGQPIADPGILTDEKITQGTGLKEFGEETYQIQLNREPSSPKVEAEPAATGTTATQ